jgi:hypothetical protein
MIASRIPRRSIIIFTCGFIALAVWTAWGVHRNLFAGPIEYRVFGAYWSSGVAANQHQNPYAVHPLTGWYYGEQSRLVPDLNLNPPILLPIFQALALLPPSDAFVIWTLLSLLIFVVTSAFILWADPKIPESGILFSLVGAPIIDTLYSGQIYAILYLLGTAAWWSIRSRRSVISATSIGLLVAIKPIFILWPLFLILTGERRLCVRSSIVALGATLLSVVAYGVGIIPQWLGAMKGDQHYVLSFDVSVPAFFHRNGHPNAGYALAAVLLASLLLYTFTVKPNVRITSGLAVSATILCSPLAWIAYAVILLADIAAGPEHRLRNWVVILLSVPTAFAWTLSNTPGRRIFGELLFFVPCCLLLSWYVHQAHDPAVRATGESEILDPTCVGASLGRLQ